MIHVDVAPAVLEWVLERSGKRAALEHRFPELRKWLAGESRPSMKQVEALAAAALTPFGYFFLDQPPEEPLPIPHFRTVADRPATRSSAELLETVYTMQRRQDWMRDYLIEQGHDRLAFGGSARLNERAESLAQKLKKALGLGPGWAADRASWTHALRFLHQCVEDKGILVMVNGIVDNKAKRKPEVDEFRGFVLADEYAPLLFVNGADSKAAQMFTLAHELAHIWFGKSAAFDLRELHPAHDVTEQACNRVAAEFLVPAAELGALWPALPDGSKRYRQVASHFRVSQLVAARRALDLELIRADEFSRFYRRYLKCEPRKQKPSSGVTSTRPNDSASLGGLAKPSCVRSRQGSCSTATPISSQGSMARLSIVTRPGSPRGKPDDANARVRSRHERLH